MYRDDNCVSTDDVDGFDQQRLTDVAGSDLFAVNEHFERWFSSFEDPGEDFTEYRFFDSREKNFMILAVRLRGY